MPVLIMASPPLCNRIHTLYHMDENCDNFFEINDKKKSFSQALFGQIIMLL